MDPIVASERPRRGWRLGVEVVAWAAVALMTFGAIVDLTSTRRTIIDGQVFVGIVVETPRSDRDAGYIDVEIPGVGLREVELSGSEQSTRVGDRIELRGTDRWDEFPVPADVSFAQYAVGSSIVYVVIVLALVALAVVIRRWRRRPPAVGYEAGATAIPIRTWSWQRKGWVALVDGDIHVVVPQFWGRHHPLVVPVADVTVLDDHTGSTFDERPRPLVRPECIPTLTTRGAFGGPNLVLLFAPPAVMPRLLFPGAGSQAGLRWSESRRRLRLDGVQVEVDDPQAAVAHIRGWGVGATFDGWAFLHRHIGPITDMVEAERVQAALDRGSRVSVAVGAIGFAVCIGGWILLAFDQWWPVVALLALATGVQMMQRWASRDPRDRPSA